MSGYVLYCLPGHFNYHYGAERKYFVVFVGCFGLVLVLMGFHSEVLAVMELM